MILNLHKDINHNLIRDIVESVIEVLNSAFVVLLEDFELWVSLIELQRNHAADNISEHVFEGQLIRVIVLNRCDGVRVVTLLALEVGLLAHHPDGFVRRFHGHGLDVADDGPILVGPHTFQSVHLSVSLLYRPGSISAGPLRVLKSVDDPFGLPLLHMLVNHALRATHHRGLVRNSLELLVLQLLGNRMLRVLWLVLIFVLLVLLLDHLQLFVHDPSRQLGVQSLQKAIRCIRGAVHDRVILSKAQIHAQLREQFLKMIPIPNFLVQFETIVELVHFDLIGMISG